MYNQEALEYSNKVISEQQQFILETMPYIKQIMLIDSEINQKCDYLYQIDGIGVCNDGITKSIQFKNRREGNLDFILIGKKLSGIAANNGRIGFWFNGTKYAILPQADIYVERLGGKDYSITREQINSLEHGLSNYDNTAQFISTIQPKMAYADDGSTFPTGDYYILIKRSILANMLEVIFKFQNPNLYS